MNNKNLMEALNDIDADLITHAEKTPSPIPIWVRLCAAAACICLIIGIVLQFIPSGSHGNGAPTILQSSISTTVPTTIPTTSSITKPTPTTSSITKPTPTTSSVTKPTPTTSSTTKPTTPKPVSPIPLSGSSLEFIVGNSTMTNTSNTQSKPLKFHFGYDGFMVQAKVISILPDTYYDLENNTNYRDCSYRVLKMQVLSVINGSGIGDEFFYLLPERLFVDMTVYDCLLINMGQLGTDGYTLKNATKNQVEAFSAPVFGNQEVFWGMYLRNYAELGRIIAFTNGVFDESLWQSPGWKWGSQFANWKDNSLVVKPGSTVAQAIENIRASIYGTPPVVKTLHFTSPEANAACEYVKPFANGVFRQRLHEDRVIFARYINGCPSGETISITFADESVTYSDIRYTKEELAGIVDIAIVLSELAHQYAQNTPTPPHIDPTGKKLHSLVVYARYTKEDGKIYGVIRTSWIYIETKDAENGKETYFHYDEYVQLFDGID